MKKASLLAGATGVLFASTAWSQVPSSLATLKADNQWRAAFGVGFSKTGGNTDASSLSLTGDGVRASGSDKLTLGGRYLRGSNNGVTSADQAALGTRYDRDIRGPWFAFGQAAYLRDRLANLSSEYAAALGVGYHVVRSDPNNWDVFAGAGYTYDNYIVPAVVNGIAREQYGRSELLVGEESSHKITDTTSFKQRAVVYPNLRDGGRRATFDAGLIVAINKTFALNATLGYRYNSDPGIGLKTSDTVFVTGITYRIE